MDQKAFQRHETEYRIAYPVREKQGTARIRHQRIIETLSQEIRSGSSMEKYDIGRHAAEMQGEAINHVHADDRKINAHGNLKEQRNAGCRENHPLPDILRRTIVNMKQDADSRNDGREKGKVHRPEHRKSHSILQFRFVNKEISHRLPCGSDYFKVIPVSEHIFPQRRQAGNPVQQTAEDSGETAPGRQQENAAVDGCRYRVIDEERGENE